MLWKVKMSKFVLFLFFIQFVFKFTKQNVFRHDYEYILGIDCHYKFHTLPRTWHEAKAICELEGANLFYSDDETEVLALIHFWNQTQPFLRSVHINLTKKDVAKSSAVFPWSRGEPNNAGGNEQCLVFSNDGTLNDENCYSNYPFICKKTYNEHWNTTCHTNDLDYKYNKILKRCYKIHKTPKNWTEAYTTCHREQSYLAVVDSVQEAQHLVNLFSPVRNGLKNPIAVEIHLGFFNSDGWITRKGVPLHETNYNKWEPSQPDGGIFEGCGAMTTEGLLKDISCSHGTLFICEHEVPKLYQ